MHALFTFFLSLLFLTSQREWCEEKSKETSEESTHWLLTICLSSLLLCSFFIPLHYISSLFWFFILLSLWLCSFVMERKWSTKWTKPKRKEKQNQELCVLCFFFVHLAYFVLHSHTITNKPIRTKRNKEHTFTTPLCSFIRLVCNGLKRWRKHETSRIKETKNVVKGVVNGVCWVKKKERRAFISFLCPFLFSSATTQHTTEQSRPVKGILGLCSCCVLCSSWPNLQW